VRVLFGQKEKWARILRVWALLFLVAAPILAVAFIFGDWVYLVLVIPVALLLGFLLWGTSDRERTGAAVRRRPQLLGPGGPDDPDR
jgi:hypothetical protein